MIDWISGAAGARQQVRGTARFWFLPHLGTHSVRHRCSPGVLLVGTLVGFEKRDLIYVMVDGAN